MDMLSEKERKIVTDLHKKEIDQLSEQEAKRLLFGKSVMLASMPDSLVKGMAQEIGCQVPSLKKDVSDALTFHLRAAKAVTAAFAEIKNSN